MKGKTTCPRCHHDLIMDLPDNTEIHKIVCPTCSHSFVIKRTCSDNNKEECGWEEYGEPRKTILSSIKKKTNRPIISSFLLLTAGVLGVFTAIIFAISHGPLMSEVESVISYFPKFDNITFSIVFAVFSIFTFAGAVTAYKRRYFLFTLLCAILGLFSIGLLIGFACVCVAIVLLILSRDEFENATKGRMF